MTECSTPASLTAKACFRETPKSTRGSSIFSPGEAFWDEAIQLADGLCGPTESLCAPAAEEIGASESQYPTKNSCNFRCGNCDGKVKEMISEGEKVVIGVSLGSQVRHNKNFDEHNSPLPVKHFDFSVEEKYLDDSILHHSDIDDFKSVVHRGVGPSLSGLSDHNAVRNANTVNWRSTSGTNEGIYGEQKMISVTANWKVDLVGKENESVKFDFQVTESIGNPESGESTPSSILPCRDRLDLDNWLPSEVCIIYKKRGISKLYPWQVLFNI